MYMRNLIVILFACALTASAHAEPRILLNLDKNGLALQGYDPVAYFTENKAVKGSPQIYATYHGALYQFTSKENKALFQQMPAKYEPAFGGYCAYGVSRNKLVEIDVNAFQIVNDRLLLQYSKGVRDDFNKDTQGNLKKADGNWSGLLEKKGK